MNVKAKNWNVCAVVAVLAMTTSFANAQSVTLFPDRDGHFHGRESFQVRNYGARSILALNQDSQTEDTPTVMSFDFSSITPGTPVTDGTLTMTTFGFYGGDGTLADREQWWTTRVDIFKIKPVDADWEEGSQSGAELAANEPGSTWNLKSNSGGPVPWAAGAALGIGGLTPSDANNFRDNGNASVTATVAHRQYAENETTLPTIPRSGNPAGGIKHNWTLPASLLQDWIDNPGNNGGMLILNIGAINNSVVRNMPYRSSDNTDTSLWPVLTFDVVPEPSSLMLLVLAVAGLAGRRRR